MIAGGTDGGRHVWDVAGQELPGRPRRPSGPIKPKAAVGDLTGAGLKGIVVTRKSGWVRLLRPDGTTLAGWPRNAQGQFGLASPTLWDMDRGGLARDHRTAGVCGPTRSSQHPEVGWTDARRLAPTHR